MACEIQKCTPPLTLNLKSIIERSAFVEKQASSETLHNHTFIAVKDAGETAAKGQLYDIDKLYHTQCDAK